MNEIGEWGYGLIRFPGLSYPKSERMVSPPLLLFSGLVFSFLFFPTFCWAKQAEGLPQDLQGERKTTFLPEAVESREVYTLPQMFVTAQKVEENEQDVPIAMATFQQKDLEQLSIRRLKEVTQYIPNVELFDDRGSGQPTWVIRGVGLVDFNSNNSPTAAIYYDEFYLTSNVMGGIGMFDMDRVEVLKGPQGGLYGRNTTGGAVRVLSKRPSLDGQYHIFGKANYGRWDRYGFEGAIGAPLLENLAFRVAGMTDQGGGWQDSLTTSRDDEHGDRDFWAVRGQLLWAPHRDVDVHVKVEGGADKSETTLGFAKAAFDNAGNFCPQALSGFIDNKNCLLWANVTNLSNALPAGLRPDQQDQDGSEVLANPINQLDNSWIGSTGQVDWHLPWGTFSLITGYLDFQNNQHFDFDGSQLTLNHEDGQADITVWSQELRLRSPRDRPFTWLTGFSYVNDEIDEDRTVDASDNVLIFGPGGTKARRTFNQQTQSWAAYGQGGYQITKHWQVHGSIRYTDEQKNLNDYTSPLFGLMDIDDTYNLDEHWSGHAGINWTPRENVLVYGKVTRSYKSGGFFGGFGTSPEELEPYKEETVWAYEVGFKSDVFERTLRVNGTFFYYDYQDVQGFVPSFSPSVGTTITKLSNLGDAEHFGVELDLLWAPPPVPGLTLKASGAWLEAKITDSDKSFTDQNGVMVPIQGRDRQFAPKWSYAFMGRYERPVYDRLLAALQVDYSWRDDLVTRDSVPTDLDFAVFGHDGYGLLNARFSIGTLDNQWALAVVGKNLLGEEYAVRATTDDLLSYQNIPGQPWSWAVELIYRL